jgi:hypothetical protein
MGWFISVLAIGVVALGAGYDRKRQQAKFRLARPEIGRWEEEGGAVRLDPEQPGAPTTTH